jgi:hypothetical protein
MAKQKTAEKDFPEMKGQAVIGKRNGSVLNRRPGAG